MHAARRAAWDLIRVHLRPGLKLLDVGCGADQWLRFQANSVGAIWHGVDIQPPNGKNDVDPRRWTGDAADPLTFQAMTDASFPLIVSVYALQHLQNREGLAWGNVRRMIAPDGLFLYFGNCAPPFVSSIDSDGGATVVGGPFRNNKRQDPCNVHTPHSLGGLALASGFQIEAIETYLYEPTPAEHYHLVRPGEMFSGEWPNGMRVTMRPIP